MVLTIKSYSALATALALVLEEDTKLDLVLEPIVTSV